MQLMRFLRACLSELASAGPRWWAWVCLLLILVVTALVFYSGQLRHGLVVTGMSDQISWGFYISNFTFLVGVAASAVLLAVPAYIFHRDDIKDVVLLGEAVAVAAVIMAISFVIVDLGRPDRLWHMVPPFGIMNFPMSLLAWDVIVLSGYLLLNILIPAYILFSYFRGAEPKPASYLPFVVLSMFWAISIHTVTAFLFSASTARPYWHTALLGPRFIASAFASGPAIMIIALQLIRRTMRYPVNQSVISTLAIIMAISLQITVFFTFVELFTDFYNEGTHSASARYLFLGLHGLSSLQPWIWTAMVLNISALGILMINPLRRHTVWLNIACVLTFLGIWIEKGVGTVIPGFIPTPLGEVAEYVPTVTELMVGLGIWSMGLLIFTVLTRIGIPLQQRLEKKTDSSL